jgi:hypothetical protein
MKAPPLLPALLAGLAALAGLALPPLPAGWVGVPVGLGAAFAAGTRWGWTWAWTAAAVASVAAAAFAPNAALALALGVALAVGGLWPRWAGVFLGAAALAGPREMLPAAVGAVLVGGTLGLVPATLPPQREGTAEAALRGLLACAALALVGLAFLAPGVSSALGVAGVLALACASGAGAVAAWRAQDGARLAASLSPLVAGPLAAAVFLLQAPLLTALLVAAAGSSPQLAATVALAGRHTGAMGRWAVAAAVTLALAGLVALRAWG